MSRKFLVTIILILFLLPFVSWYYLQSGLNWRKKAQEIMDGTESFPVGEYLMADGRKLTPDSLDNHVTLVCYLPCGAEGTEQMEVLEALYDQFKETNKAAYVLLDSCQSTTQFPSTKLHKSWFVIPCSDSMDICKSLRVNWAQDKPFALVDRKGVIRSYYGIGSQDDKRTLVEHMSLLLPRERQEEVELKRGEKK